ncbi:MAG: hypothetical protein MI924_16025, partial [Chloroflexales bacterium]|nr:hypothetical protein [Chloroflexales bacterium]
RQGDLDLVAAIDARLEASKLAQEGRAVSRRCGGRILISGAELYGGECLPAYAQRVAAGQAPGHQAVALALLAVSNDLDEDTAVMIELHCFLVSLLSAAIRLTALDHMAAQRLLLRAQSVLGAALTENRTMHWQEIGGFAPQIELMQFHHVHAVMHMFVS